MQALNDWAIKNLGTWVTDFAALFLIIAVGLLVILLITFIIVAYRHAHNNKKFRKLKEQINASGDGKSEAELREQIRAELEAEYANGTAAPDNSDEVQRLQAECANKQRVIDELNARLSDANEAYSMRAAGAVDRELQKRVDELTRENDELTRRNEELTQANIEFNETYLEQKNEVSMLKAENAEIKAQALQQQLAQRDREAAKPATAAKAEPATPKQTAKTTAKTATATKAKKEEKSSAPTQEDEYDEYYDDYGDESSEIKVTLKFDRNKNNWVILRTDTDRAYRRLATKQEALVVAKDLARRLHAQLVVHKKDGKFQKV